MGLFDESFSSVEVAKILGVHRVTVATWIKNGALKAARTPGGRYLVSKSTLRRFLRERDMPVPDFLGLEAKKTIVAVDDEKEILGVLQGLFAESDLSELYHINTFSNPLEAALFIGDTKPDMVLLDLVMPYMNGFELAVKIKQTSPNTKTIVITGHAGMATSEKLRESQIDGLLIKPFDLQTLKATLAEHLL